MIRVDVVAICTSRADDLAFASLIDAAGATQDLADARIVGGHMVGLLLAAFPVPGVSVRRTTDADAGLTAEIAASEVVVDRLQALGYVATSSNRFERDGRTIDLLVEIQGTRFEARTLGGRQFDASPGLDLALVGPPIEVSTTVVFTDRHEEVVVVRVPSVEMATILKAYAATSRNAAKDIADLHHLLEIRQQHGREAIGGWALDREPAVGRRLDAARVLRAVRARDVRFAEGSVVPERFIALVREHIARV